MKASHVVWTLGLAVGLLVSAAAQTQTVQVVVPESQVRLEPSGTSATIASPPIGTVLEVVGTADPGWLRVRLPKDGSGFERAGFVESSAVRPIGGAPSPPTSLSSTRPAVAILDFDYGTVKREWSGITVGKRDDAPLLDVWDVGKGIADLLVDELLQRGEVRLLERKRVADILNEQELAKSNRADVSAAEVAQLGKVLGARFFIAGSVVKFGSENNRVGAGAGIGRVIGGIGGFGLRRTTARVGLTARVIDSSSSEILSSSRSQGESKRRGLLLAGIGIGGGGAAGGAIDMSSSDFHETILGEATLLAVRDLASKLVAQVRNSDRAQ